MAQSNLEVQSQIFLKQANNGDQKAVSELLKIATQCLERDEDEMPQNANFGASLLEKLAESGNKEALEKLASFAAILLYKNPEFGFKWLTVANKLGNVQAKHKLATCFLYGTGTGIDVDQAIRLFKECYQAGEKTVLADLNGIADELLSGKDFLIEQDLKKAVEILTFTAEKGSAIALRNLTVVGVSFYKGTHPYPKNVDRAITILKLAAGLGNAESLKFLNGVGAEILKEHPKKAFALFKFATELGHHQAKCNLAICFAEGLGTEVDVNKAIPLFRECYEKEKDPAILGSLNTIASNLLLGKNSLIKQDLKMAVELFTFAAQEGNTAAIDNLGLVGGWFYGGVSPCPKDVKKGIEIFKIAANFGSKQALNNLNGVGAEILKEHPQIAFELFSLANKLGHLEAKRNLAVCFLKGTGTEKDINKAIGLFKEAYAQGHKDALEDLNIIAYDMLPDEDAEAAPDLNKALELLIFVAQKGHPMALDNLSAVGSWFYFGSSFCPKDPDQGITILKMAAKLGHQKSLDDLNSIAAETLEEHPKIAFELFSLTTELGHPEARRNLGVCFLNGTGTKKNINEAIRSFKEAYKQGYKAALKDLSGMAANMLPKDDAQTAPDLKTALELLTFTAQNLHQMVSKPGND